MEAIQGKLFPLISSSLFPLCVRFMLGTLLPPRPSIGEGSDFGAFSKELGLLLTVMYSSYRLHPRHPAAGDLLEGP